MSYLIKFTPQARRTMKKLDRAIQKQVLDCIVLIEDNPRPPGVKKLAGIDDLYRVRFGDYRIVYQIDDEGHSVLIAKVGHRRDIYRR